MQDVTKFHCFLLSLPKIPKTAYRLVGKKVSDKRPYLEKIDKMKASLFDVYNCQRGSYIVSLSRKGPRLLEKIFEGEEQERKELNTVTEIALPFIYHSLCERIEKEGDKAEIPEIRLVDDAIYYGSTIEGLWNEMQLYEQIYGLEGRIKHPVHACIKSLRSKPLSDMHIDADVCAVDGFEHYFVKNLTADLRTLHKCLEVEFPIVMYTSSSPIDQNAFIRRICEVYDSAYRIDHPDATVDDGGQMISSVNVLLEGTNAIFEKMRITMNTYEVRIACMAPRNIYMSYRTLSRLFLNTEVSSIWKWALTIPEDIASRVAKEGNFISAYGNLMHNVIKSLVALANYFYSYNTIVEQKNKLLSIFTSLGYSMNYMGVAEQDVFYLIGDRQKAREIMNIFFALYTEGKALKPHLQGIGEANIDYQVFESDFPEGLIENIGLQNDLLLDKCGNIYEALSAMFFNQTLLLDNGTRGLNKKDDNRRLRFGHTFGSLYKTISEYGTDNAKTVHKWVDRRIDQGCIVPQYVLDTKSNFWTRVFRPGENEDVVLGQLARFSTFCFSCLNKAFGTGWLPEQLLSDMLTIVVLKSKYDLSQELGIELFVNHRKLSFSNEGGGDEATEVIDYLKRMSVLKEGSSGIEIGSSLHPFNFGDFTSMGEEIDSDIREFVKYIMQRCDDGLLSLYETTAFTNLFFVESEPLLPFMDEYRQAVKYIGKMIVELKAYDNRQDWLRDNIEGKFADYYYRMDEWLVRPLFWSDFKEREDLSRVKFEALQRNLVNYHALSDALFLLICMNDPATFYKIVEFYDTPSWGDAVIDKTFISESVKIYKDDEMEKDQKELLFLETAEKLLEKIMI